MTLADDMRKRAAFAPRIFWVLPLSSCRVPGDLTVCARGLGGRVRAGCDAVEVLGPLVASVFADPGDQIIPARIAVQQFEQLPALAEAVLVGNSEVLIEGPGRPTRRDLPVQGSPSV